MARIWVFFYQRCYGFNLGKLIHSKKGLISLYEGNKVLVLHCWASKGNFSNKIQTEFDCTKP